MRGSLTREQLNLPSTVPLGDPGLIISQMVDPRPISSRRGVGLLPHFRTWNTGEGRRLISAYAASGSHVLEPSMAPLVLAKAIARCEFLITSSLHGFILAHALGVPAQLVQASEQEPEFKYADYLSAMGTAHQAARASDLLDPVAQRRAWHRLEPEAPALRETALHLAESLVSAARAWEPGAVPEVPDE
ncbi:hypothetical protein B2K11_04130 [Microbacterium sp. B35-30]|nr:hypothetical protein B2K11_04130 [Microbacterium sp. B35-30]